MEYVVCIPLTRNDITSIGFILVLDEAEAAHELDLPHSARAIREVSGNVVLGDCRPVELLSAIVQLSR